jgi:hypothetical protein
MAPILPDSLFEGVSAKSSNLINNGKASSYCLFLNKI